MKCKFPVSSILFSFRPECCLFIYSSVYLSEQKFQVHKNINPFAITVRARFHAICLHLVTFGFVLLVPRLTATWSSKGSRLCHAPPVGVTVGARPVFLLWARHLGVRPPVAPARDLWTCCSERHRALCRPLWRGHRSPGKPSRRRWIRWVAATSPAHFANIE